MTVTENFLSLIILTFFEKVVLRLTECNLIFSWGNLDSPVPQGY
jgi:hypothetical protein